jgi:hypothetical protein
VQVVTALEGDERSRLERELDAIIAARPGPSVAVLDAHPPDRNLKNCAQTLDPRIGVSKKCDLRVE